MANEKKSWYKRWWAITIWVILGLAIIGSLFGSDETPAPTPSDSAAPVEQKQEISVVSTTFDDFAIKCDLDATNLQKQDLFKKSFKDKYVEWTGEVTSISEGNRVQVKHCPSTFTSDILISMRNDQRDKLLEIREGDSITYRARLTRLGDILGLSASDGIVVE